MGSIVLATLTLVVALTAGCGGSSPVSNGEAGKSATEILADARHRVWFLLRRCDTALALGL
jgi:hypothetical protein